MQREFHICLEVSDCPGKEVECLSELQADLLSVEIVEAVLGRGKSHEERHRGLNDGFRARQHCLFGSR